MVFGYWLNVVRPVSAKKRRENKYITKYKMATLFSGDFFVTESFGESSPSHLASHF
jgi:hypothetical protein